MREEKREGKQHIEENVERRNERWKEIEGERKGFVSRKRVLVCVYVFV